jgi:TRAP-type C4-dicarboxylate transport system substrate-binding protein
MKRSITLMSMILVVIVVSAGILTGCSPSSPTAPATTGNNATPVADVTPTASTAPQKVYEIKFTDQFTPVMEDAKINEELGRLIEEHTGGQVKFTYYHASALGKTSDFLNLLNGGVADAIHIICGWFPQNFAFFMGLEIPQVGFKDRSSRLEADWMLFEAGYLKEFDGYKVLAFNATPAMNIYMTQNIPTAADLRGKKIRASNATVRTWLENLGAAPNAMPPADLYMAMDRGTIDGVFTAYSNYMQQKYFEVCKYAIWNPMSIGSSPILMSKTVWDSLPADVQAGIDEAIEAYRNYYVDYYTSVDSKAVDSLKSSGANVYSFEGDDAAKLTEAAAPLKEEWVKQMEAKGLPAKEMFDEVAKMLAAK